MYLEASMSARLVGVMIVLFSIVLAGCSNNPSSGPVAEAGKKTTKAPADPGTKKPMGTEAEARAILKAALDSWAFGDTLEKFEKDHPGVQFFDTNWITKKRLGRYEIGNMRKDGITFEFLVTLIFREDADDVTKNGDYHVTKDADGWVITAGAR
jgi:hypothetical protein